MARPLCSVALALALSGCASSYKPAVSPRVAVVQTASGVAFVRGGKQYDHGFFGGGLGEAVAGVPAAEEHASTHQSLLIGGFAFSLGGVALGTASIATAARADSTDDSSLYLGLAAGAVVSALVGSVMYASSATHVWDAINVYNDEQQRAAIEKWRKDRSAREPDAAE